MALRSRLAPLVALPQFPSTRPPPLDNPAVLDNDLPDSQAEIEAIWAQWYARSNREVQQALLRDSRPRWRCSRPRCRARDSCESQSVAGRPIAETDALWAQWYADSNIEVQQAYYAIAARDGVAAARDAAPEIVATYSHKTPKGYMSGFMVVLAALTIAGLIALAAFAILGEMSNP